MLLQHSLQEGHLSPLVEAAHEHVESFRPRVLDDKAKKEEERKEDKSHMTI